jgi:hypothetical protein
LGRGGSGTSGEKVSAKKKPVRKMVMEKRNQRVQTHTLWIVSFFCQMRLGIMNGFILIEHFFDIRNKICMFIDNNSI